MTNGGKYKRIKSIPKNRALNGLIQTYSQKKKTWWCNRQEIFKKPLSWCKMRLQIILKKNMDATAVPNVFCTSCRVTSEQQRQQSLLCCAFPGRFCKTDPVIRTLLIYSRQGVYWWCIVRCIGLPHFQWTLTAKLIHTFKGWDGCLIRTLQQPHDGSEEQEYQYSSAEDTKWIFVPASLPSVTCRVCTQKVY